MMSKKLLKPSGVTFFHPVICCRIKQFISVTVLLHVGPLSEKESTSKVKKLLPVEATSRPFYRRETDLPPLRVDPFP